MRTLKPSPGSNAPIPFQWTATERESSARISIRWAGMIHLGIPHLGRSSHCRVVWCSAPINGAYEIGVEMEGASNIWGLHGENDRAGNDSTGDFVLLVQMLEEKGIIRQGEFQARR